MDSTPLDQLTFERFSQLLHARFTVALPNGRRVELELAEIEQSTKRSDGNKGDTGPSHENFALIFRSIPGEHFPQSTYSLEQEQLGRFDLFLVPIGREGQSILYQAVFNRFTSPK